MEQDDLAERRKKRCEIAKRYYYRHKAEIRAKQQLKFLKTFNIKPRRAFWDPWDDNDPMKGRILDIPILTCDNGHKYVPVKGQCLMCEFKKP